MGASQEQNRVVALTVEVLPGAIRIDKYLGDLVTLELSRTKIRKLIDDQLVLVDGEPVPARFKVRGGENIQLTIPPEPPSELLPEDIPLDIVYEDEYLAIINKPAGLVTHPAPGNATGTLVNALVHHYNSLAAGASDRPGIVHRLDKNTSGLMVVARRDEIYTKLQLAIQSRELKRRYLALVFGHFREDSGVIDLPVGRSSRDRKKMAVMEQTGRTAQTRYELVERFRSYDLLKLSLMTGRTHQIRVHCAHFGHPVFGDPEYGGRNKQLPGMFAPERPLALELLGLIKRQALHAAELEFSHPVTGEELRFTAVPPDDFRAVLDLLDRKGR